MSIPTVVLSKVLAQCNEKELPFGSAVGSFYLFKDGSAIFKRFKELFKKKEEYSMKEVNKRKKFWAMTNSNPLFMKVSGVVEKDPSGSGEFEGLILENLSGYSSINGWCEKQNRFTEKQFSQLISQYLSVCKTLFAANLCSHIEHGGNIMIRIDKDSNLTIKVVDMDDIGEAKFTGCKESLDNQFDTIRQLDLILLNCAPVSSKSGSLYQNVAQTVDMSNKGKFVFYSGGKAKYESIDQLIKLWGLASVVSEKDIKIASSIFVPKEWECPACTFINKADSVNCEICGTAKPKVVAQAPKIVHPTEWECERCTFLNKESNKVCEMCGAQKPAKGGYRYKYLANKTTYLRLKEGF